MIPTPYPQRAATSDQNPGRLTLTVVQGDTLFKRIRLVVRHDDPNQPGTVIRVPVLVAQIVFESLVYEDRTGAEVTRFDIADDPDDDSTIQVSLDATVTARMTPGTYAYWITGNDIDSGRTVTFAQHKLEVTRRPPGGNP